MTAMLDALVVMILCDVWSDSHQDHSILFPLIFEVLLHLSAFEPVSVHVHGFWMPWVAWFLW